MPPITPCTCAAPHDGACIVPLVNARAVEFVEALLENTKAGRIRDVAFAARAADGDLVYGYEAEAGLMPLVHALDSARELVAGDVDDVDLAEEQGEATEEVGPFAVRSRGRATC